MKRVKILAWRRLMCFIYFLKLHVQIDPAFEPALMESRTLFGLQMQQRRNDAIIDESLFANIVTDHKEVKKKYPWVVLIFLYCYRFSQLDYIRNYSDSSILNY